MNSTIFDENNRVYFYVFIFCERYSIPKYIQKALVISSFYLFPEEFLKVLSYLYNTIINESNTKLSLEDMVHQMVFRSKSPLSSLDIKFQFGYGEILFNLGKLNEIPKPHLNIKMIFDFFEPEKFLDDVFLDVMLEKPILVFSPSNMVLSNFIQSIISLLYPFKYSSTIVEILPKSYFKIISHLNSFLIGINAEFEDLEEFFIDNNITFSVPEIKIVKLISYQKSETFVYKKKLTENTISILEININSLNNSDLISNQNNQENIYLPRYYTQKLIKIIIDNASINTNQSPYIKTTSISNVINDKKDSEFILNEFYHFFVSIFLLLPQYIKNSKEWGIENFKNYFSFIPDNFVDKPKFLEKIEKGDDLFYKQFFNTKIFKIFLYELIFHPNIESLRKAIIFVENIIAKKNRATVSMLQMFKEDTPFLKNPNINSLKTVAFTLNFKNNLNYSDLSPQELNYLAKVNIKSRRFPNLDKNKTLILMNIIPGSYFSEKEKLSMILISALKDSQVIKNLSGPNYSFILASKKI